MLDKEQIKKVATEHFSEFPLLQIVDTDLAVKIEIIYKELPTIYKKLKDKDLLPEGVDINVFMQIVVPRLEREAQQVHIQQVFGF